jgi:Uma2 family endonuclease
MNEYLENLAGNEDNTADTNKGMEDMGSVNHSLVQTRLIRMLPDDSKYTIATELSLDVSNLDEDLLKSAGATKSRELKPDICLYPPGVISFIDSALADDLIRFDKPPVLAIEIVSPSQSNRDILAKFRVYFMVLKVKSCWLVDPVLKAIVVYTSPSEYKIFPWSEGEVIDSLLDIRLPLTRIFS